MNRRNYPVALIAALALGVILGLGAPPAAHAYDNGVNDLHGGTPIGGGDSGPSPDPDGPWDDDADGDGEGKEGEPVDLFSGQFYFEVNDVTIPGRIPLRVKRFYRSATGFQGSFGYGWNLMYNERIFILAETGNLLHRSDNTMLREFKNNGDNTFSPPAGCYYRITRNPDGTYTLREKHGAIRIYNAEGCLTEVRDRSGNQLLITYQNGGRLPISAISQFTHFTNAIVVARDYQITRIEAAFNDARSGRFVEFTYDANGRIIRMADFTGRTWTYTYDAAQEGLLLSATTPPVPGYPAGLTTTYTYSATNGNRLASITDPDGRTYLRNFYNAQDRIARQEWGSATWHFGYPSDLPDCHQRQWLPHRAGVRHQRQCPQPERIHRRPPPLRSGLLPDQVRIQRQQRSH
ncbi:MAG TPA: DUF6531 domain-containing protein [Candidatus Paceibacterota bacterium]|nr:DUF6531 domain-containing protein [Candidatus Paceibacterota bacterium]